MYAFSGTAIASVAVPGNQRQPPRSSHSLSGPTMAAAAGPVVESLTTAISAAVAAVAGKFIIYPLDFFKLRLSAKQEHETAGSIFADVYKKHGILGVYLGLGALPQRYAALRALLEVRPPARAVQPIGRGSGGASIF